MPTVVRMPEVLANAGEGVIQTWLVGEGQEVAVGDPLAEIETEKAVVEYVAEIAGTVGRLIASPGSTIAVGEPIAVMLAPGETAADIDAALLDGAEVSHAAAPTTPEPATAGAAEQSVEHAATPTVETAAGNGSSGGRRLFATPLVRRIARERGIDLATVKGTGPAGRIVRRDLDRLEADKTVSSPAPQPVSATTAAPEASGYTDVPLTGMRKAVARRLTESKTEVPHFYLSADCRVDELIALRHNVNAAAAAKVSLNDFILKAVACALIEVPDANAIWNGDSIRRFEHADIAMAVAVDGGLLTPVLRGVDAMPLSVLAAEAAALAQRSRDGQLRQHELEGGSFSVSNLGMFGVTEFSAILNPPQSGILAVGAATQRPVVDDGELTVGTVMTVTLSADHRVIDGAVAAAWMAAFVRRIENPLTILI
ncbi:pyruvate dehydrogenase complex dihydrolipoamide acetyltransferase [Mycolicibacterium agri]|uniref:Dihydrolipoamide acetyltransferase component of pyruvate dehydrogenase complex n=1 Tax=Mycolicibacterium agri TaxID=36811 RepID=A0A2A7N0M3_MYCAG|nr:dihydrolipoamide acetyltransferase family protein [Mycolicibacterium agri]PEG37081.1 pyruvate dehydrogenase complex dihydrolipoamide acetyltransferase [Mycolicibacterium agri]GFG52078.1 acetyltransferase component of pyruvate dehydrogenase complex [Mycolicibacterium agri]